VDESAAEQGEEAFPGRCSRGSGLPHVDKTFPEAFDILCRSISVESAVLAAELGSAGVADSESSLAGIHVPRQHEVPGLLETQHLLVLQRAQARHRAEVLIERGYAHMSQDRQPADIQLLRSSSLADRYINGTEDQPVLVVHIDFFRQREPLLCLLWGHAQFFDIRRAALAPARAASRRSRTSPVPSILAAALAYVIQQALARRMFRSLSQNAVLARGRPRRVPRTHTMCALIRSFHATVMTTFPFLCPVST
jgi:hypothetical protein